MNQDYPTQPQMLLLGDSITAGFDLAKHLPDVPAVNHGISGLSSVELLEAMKSDWFNPQPDWVFLCIGTNDIARKVSFSTMLDHTTRLVHRIRQYAPKTRVFLCSLFPTLHNPPRPNPLIRKYNQLLHSLAIDLNVDYMHLYPYFSDENENLRKQFTHDGLHLNEEAYRNWANLLHILWYSSLKIS